MLVLLLAKLSDPEESNWKKTKIKSPSVGDYFLAMAEFKYSGQLKSCVKKLLALSNARSTVVILHWQICNQAEDIWLRAYRRRHVLGSLDPSSDRVNTLRTKVRTLEHELHNKNCTIASTKCSNPYNVGWEGVFIPPTLLHLSRNAPAVPTKVKRLQQGYLVISLGWTVQLGYPHPDHVFFCPSGTFGSGP